MKNKNLIAVAIIAVVNALGYGIIIPILYSYSQKFGLSDFQNGLLFATFSLCQFISSPVIGRLSDKYGRKPLLLVSLFGTAVSFFMMGFAKTGLMLFLARALDGITAGNITVATAVISDTTKGKQRTQGFAIIGASFGLGLILGPVISTFTLAMSLSLPFIIAGIISLVSVLLTIVLLKETNKVRSKISQRSLFNLDKLFSSLKDKHLSPLFLTTLFYSTAFSSFIFGFQPFLLKSLQLSPQQISMVFTLFGILGVVSQLFVVKALTKKLSLKKAALISLCFVAIAFFLVFMSTGIKLFILASIMLGVFNGTISPIVQSNISAITDKKSQGSIIGINASYMSIGQIIGPIMAGIAVRLGLEFAFISAFISIVICIYLVSTFRKPLIFKESAF